LATQPPPEATLEHWLSQEQAEQLAMPVPVVPPEGIQILPEPLLQEPAPGH